MIAEKKLKKKLNAGKLFSIFFDSAVIEYMLVAIIQSMAMRLMIAEISASIDDKNKIKDELAESVKKQEKESVTDWKQDC